jgi:hypothetical protein
LVRKTVIALSVLLLASASAYGATTRLAVVVGANRGGPSQVVLRHAQRDAVKIAGVLRELGGVTPENLILLTDGATAQQLDAAMARAERRAVSERADGNKVFLYFYYSGHATRKELQLTGTRYSIVALRDRLKSSKATLRVGILDACHSGEAIRTKGGKRKKKRPVNFYTSGTIAAEGYAILTSSAAGEKSQESDEIRGSFFTHHLATAMRGAADVNSDGLVTLGEAYRYAYQRTLKETTASTPSIQHPNYDMAIKGGNDVVLTSLSRANATLTLHGTPEAARWTVFEPATGLVVAEIFEHPKRSVTVAVPAARLEIYRRRDGRVSRGHLDMRSRSEAVLERDDLTPVPMTAYLFKGELGLRVSAMVGVQSFASGKFREEYLDSMPLFSLGVAYQGIGWPGLGAALDLSFSHNRQHMAIDAQPYTQSVTLFQGGIGLPYQWDFGSFSFSLGPRVALMFLQRDKEFQGGELSTDAVTLWSVGGAGRLGWRLKYAPVSVGLEGRLSYTPAPTEDGLRNELLVEAQVAAGFHF